MIYSIWNQGKRVYEYFETPRDRTDTSAPKPKHLHFDQLGLTPESAAWPLPSDAVRVGEGKYPKGFIATKKGGFAALSGFIPRPTPLNLVLGGVVGYFIWKQWRKSRA